MNHSIRTRLLLLAATLTLPWIAGAATTTAVELKLATFAVDVTIPLGHRCMGILPTKSLRIDDPLEARGFVVMGADKPLVLVAVDWCEIRNGAYDQWREALAAAAGTVRERVLISSVHQHDAPVVDSGAQDLLDEAGLTGELYDRPFHDSCVVRAAAALREAMKHPHRVTHLGTGQATVERIASNRRVVDSEGQVSFARGSSSGGNPALRDAPAGLIDPHLKTISFWDGETPLLALHSYATHPMSHYGQGQVSADFVGLARRLRQKDDPSVMQIYVSGPSGDVTAGKFNDGSSSNRPVLAQRLCDAMQAAWKATVRWPVGSVAFRLAELELPFRSGEAYRRPALTETLRNDKADTRERILAAMALSSLNRIERGQKIDMPCIEITPAASSSERFNAACIVVFPGESFVGYQIMAQRLRPEAFVLCIGYGECWPGYVPTDAAFNDNFTDKWLWAGQHCESRIQAALQQALIKH